MTTETKPAAEVAPQPPPAAASVSRATLISGGFNVLGSALGLLRDLLLAAYFGATGTMDAFLVAWTVPETAAPLLIEDAMAFLMVPAFSRASEAEQKGDAGAVRRLAGATLPPLLALLSVASLLGVVAAPLLVRVLAPGLAQPHLAVECTRLASLAVLAIGVTGYLSAALRSRHVFGPPAAIYTAFNGGLVVVVFAFHDAGVVAAASGVVIGAFGMVAVQGPSFVRRVGMQLRLPPADEDEDGAGAAPGRRVALTKTLAFSAVAPIGLFTVSRQAQVFVERFLGSEAPTGTISHLNYAQKIAQVPMSIVMVVSVVSFPALSRALAAGRRGEAGRRLAADLRVSSLAILAATAFLMGCAPLLVHFLFQRGQFSPADTAATAAVIRVYSLGLFGQVLVGVTVRVYFAGAARRTSMWFPTQAMLGGLALTMLVGGFAAPRWGGRGIALANALGISLTALILLFRVGRKSAFSLRAFTVETAALGMLAAAATAAAWAIGSSPLPLVPAGLLAAAAVAAVMGAPVAVFLYRRSGARWLRTRRMS